MPALLDVARRPAEPADQEVAEALLGASQAAGRIHRAEDVVGGNLLVESSDETMEAFFADGGVNLMFVQSIAS